MISLGIDLGTTNTVLAIGRECVRLGAKDPLLPSVVAYPPSGKTLVGGLAARRRPIDPQNTIVSAKRIIGRKLTSQDTAMYREQHPSLTVEESADGRAAFSTRAGVVTPVDVGARIIKTACSLGKMTGEDMAAVVTVPAHFGALQRDATIEAARLAGIESVAVIDEPLSTALAYSKHALLEGMAAVYDLGGGTFDFALIECRDASYKVIATAGDQFLGGDDIDSALASWAREEVLKIYGWDLRDDPVTYDGLVIQCEKAKRRLSHAEETTIELTQIDPAAPADSSLTVNRETLRSLINELVQRTFMICDDVLKESGLTTEDVDHVFMAGGSALLPLVWSGLEAYFGKEPRCDIAPMEVVAVGAGIAAKLRYECDQ